MPVFTVQNMVDRAAALADMHDNFVTPQQWLAWFNEERRALEIFKVTSGASTSNLQSVSVTAPDRVALATSGVNDFMALVGVWEVKYGRLRPLRIVTMVDNFRQDTGGAVTGPAQYVMLEDNNDSGDFNSHLRFYPRDTSGNYLIMLLQAPAVATALTDTFSQPMGLEERIALGMAKKALIKEESDTTDIKDLIRAADANVEKWAWGRAIAQAKGVRNVDELQRGWISLDGWVPPGQEFWTWL